MAVLPILLYPNTKLTVAAAPVVDFGEQTQSMIDDLLETVRETKNCAGLAAVQVDIPFRITVIGDEDPDNPLILVNPEITQQSTETTYTEEGCLSVPAGIYEKVKRAEAITVKAQDRHGNVLDFEQDGFLAKVIQHEVDHLNGVVFLDHLSKLKRTRAEQKIKKWHQDRIKNK